MKLVKFMGSIAFIFLFLLGCNQQDDVNSKLTIQPTKTSTTQSIDINQENAITARAILLEKDEVKKVRVIEGKNLIIAAVELKHWNTFRAKKLKEQMKKKLEKEIKSKKIEVTTDHKIFIELEDLERKIANNSLSKKKLEKDLKKINKLMKEQT